LEIGSPGVVQRFPFLIYGGIVNKSVFDVFDKNGVERAEFGLTG
jgi:hypothetical protein